MYLETMLFAIYLPLYAKGGVKRIRPYVYNPDAPEDLKLKTGACKSFFSSHTTIVFSSAIFLSTVYSEYFPDSEYKKHIWAGSLLTAGAVGFLRYEAGAHFPSDIIVGAIVGSGIGYFIPYFHKTSKKTSLSLYPSFHENNFLLTLQVEF